jgi:SHS2 domain-containing protein
MGDTTDDLLEAAEAALTGVVTIDAVEQLHKNTASELKIPASDVDPLLAELRTLYFHAERSHPPIARLSGILRREALRQNHGVIP